MKPEITKARYAFLLSGDSARTTFGKATVAVKADRFVMTGPSGVHSLLIEATDVERLNAHWQGFCSHPANA